jgi:4'-phosphopantetheinyl transferase
MGLEWQPARGRPVLQAGDAHVWRINLAQPAEVELRLEHALAPDERARAARFYFEADRRRFTVARGALRHVLARYTEARAEDIAFAYGSHGKPALPDAPLQFNLAHAGELALIAVTLHAAIGVDLEDMRRPMDDMDDVAQRFFAREEWAQFNALPDDEKRSAFFRCWTRKEAFIKAIGDGLSYPLDRFAVVFAAGQPSALAHIDGDATAARAWSLYNLEPGEGHAGAVAIHAASCRLACWAGPLMEGME